MVMNFITEPISQTRRAWPADTVAPGKHAGVVFLLFLFFIPENQVPRF